MLSNNYSVFVSAGPHTECWITDGKKWEKITTDKLGHKMNFNGFDDEGNILVVSWGKIYKVPKEFYSKLEFMTIKTNDKTNDKIR